MPSVNSRSMPNVWPSSTLTTPSLPTFSIASAITSPISSSPAEIVATRAICSLPEISFDCDSMCLTTSSTAFSIPRLSASGLAPAATFFRPSRTIDWASTVAGLVPSPATSFLADELSALVLENVLDLDLTRDRHTVVGDRGRAELLVEDHVAALGAECDLDGVGYRIDALLERLAGLSLVVQFLVCHIAGFSWKGLGLALRQHVRLAEDEQFLAVHLDLGAAVLAVEHL